MKFGQELTARERERFRGHYLNYRGLKRLLKELAGAKKPEAGAAAAATSTAAAARFITELQREVTRINVYVAACQMQLDAERRKIEGEAGGGRAVTAAAAQHPDVMATRPVLPPSAPRSRSPGHATERRRCHGRTGRARA